MSLSVYPIHLGLTVCYLIKDKGAVLFDAGLPRKINRFKRSLSRIPVDPSEINLVILSHAHFDQAGTAKDIRELKLSIQLTGVLFIRIK
ncbi:MAG TPA: MBL fold metallo-hydrolase [Bacteroidales bacterium]|nr:MBL fold metallo-hydrolase [Bacteroidales bacterium]